MPAWWNANARYASSVAPLSPSARASQATGTPRAVSARQAAASRVVLPKPPGAAMKVARRRVGAHRAVSADRSQ